MAGRTKSNLTQIKADSKEARTRLKQMVDSYVSAPSEKKAKAIMHQLENVEISERALREANQNHEAKLFGSSEDAEEETTVEEPETEEPEEDTEEPVPSAPSTPKPEIPRPVTAKNQQKK